MLHSALLGEVATLRDLDIEIPSERGTLLDESEPRFGLRTHKSADSIRDRFTLVSRDLHAQQQTLCRVHGRLFELLGIHLAQTFEPADLDLFVFIEFVLEQFIAVRIVARIV